MNRQGALHLHPSRKGFERFIPSPAHPECERSERIEGAIWAPRLKAHRPLDTLASLALGVSGFGRNRQDPETLDAKPRQGAKGLASWRFCLNPREARWYSH